MSFFDQEAKDYDSWYLTKEGNYIISKENNLLDSLLKERYKNALDVGCGTGVHTSVLAKKSEYVIGIDISEEMLQQAKSKNIPNAKFMSMSAMDLQFEDNTFDCIISMAALEFMPEKDTFFNECFRVLKKNGTLIVGSIQRDSYFGEMYLSEFFQENTVFKHASFLTKSEISKFYKEFYQETKECLFNSYENISNNPEIKDIKSSKPGGFMISIWKKGE